ncbi:MAG: carboxylesterase family protein [Clostridia bacterium]|nr:carboxylesterase family protein [Clostridia bacterium]
MNRKQTERERIRKTFGVNRAISGEYDPALAARCHNGTFVGKTNGTIDVFYGIPFAVPPVGALRWKKPEPVPESDAVSEAYYNGRSPIQSEWPTERASFYPQGEDCLYLNVWKNRTCLDAHKPVMVFFHGGAYGWGGTADPMYDGTNFVTEQPGIVLITVGYRVGLMGFVDFSEVPGGEAYSDAPNLGLYDQIEALRWVKRNAAAFGGDPENITIFGESAGGGSVSLLPCIPEAKGLFRRVIAESGSVALTFSKEECREFTRRLLKTSGAKTMDDLCALSEAELMRINEPLNPYNNFPQRDGKLIPEDAYEPYRNGVTADVDMMIGTNADEMNYWIGEIGGIIPFGFGIPIKFENDLKKLSKEDRARARRFLRSEAGHWIWKLSAFYTEMMFRLPAIEQAEQHAAHGGKAFLYYWMQPSKLWQYGACHAAELAYVFGNTEDTVYTGEPANRELAKRVMQIWAKFATDGDPGTPELLWPPYDGTTRETMVLCRKPRTERDLRGEQRKLLAPLLRYRINPSYATMDYRVPFVYRSIGKVLLILALTVGLMIWGIHSLF